jgi:hypothetical protein
MKILRSITVPIREGLTIEERWHGPDQGLIASWERGRERSLEDPAMAAQAGAGQLVILPWKGGVEKVLKKKEKFGTFRYLAMWQGLRGDNLDIDLTVEVPITCSVTGLTVIFTNDSAEYAPE